MGRVHYSDDQIVSFKEKIIEGIYKGNSLMRTLKKNKDLPTRKTIFTWLNPSHKDYDKDFSYNYSIAREESAHIDAERAEDIYRLVKKGKIEPAQGQVMLKSITWAAGVKMPKKYGKKIDVTTGGKDIVQQVAIFEIPDNGRGDLKNTPEEGED